MRFGEFFYERDKRFDIRPDKRVGEQNVLCPAFGNHFDFRQSRAFEVMNAHSLLHFDHFFHFVRLHVRPQSLCPAGDFDRFAGIFENFVFIVDQSGR